MSAKEEYCFRVMRKYGLLVSFDGEPRTSNVPALVDDGDETLAQWVRRVLGPDVDNVKVYTPEVLAGTRKIRNLQKVVEAQHLKKVVQAQARVQNALAAVHTDRAVERTERIHSTISEDTIQEQLDDIGEALEPSVREFFQRKIENDKK